MRKAKIFLSLILLGLCITIICFCVVISPLWGGIKGFSEKDAFVFFEENKKELYYVQEALRSVPNQTIKLKREENGEVINIADIVYKELEINEQQALDNAISHLYENGVEFIVKKDAWCQFALWSSLDSSKGIIYTENRPLSIEYIVNSKEIYSNWYYFYDCQELWYD